MKYTTKFWIYRATGQLGLPDVKGEFVSIENEIF